MKLWDKRERLADRPDLPDAPKHVKRAVPSSKKRWGIESCFFRRWAIHGWYASEKQRDQAFERLTKHKPDILIGSSLEPQYRKVER